MRIVKKTLTNSVSGRKPFVRRQDLTEEIRIHIGICAYVAQQKSQWGDITAIAREYGVSRPFVYDQSPK